MFSENDLKALVIACVFFLILGAMMISCQRAETEALVPVRIEEAKARAAQNIAMADKGLVPDGWGSWENPK